jgi:hypothetical protein
MLKPFLVLGALITVASGFGAAQATVRVEPVNLQGPRLLEGQTKEAAIRDYLQAWQSMRDAFEQNHASLLESDFIGTAREKLTNTIQQQAALGIRTRYQDRSHDLQIVMYSPEGLSIMLIDKVGYDMQIVDHGKVVTTQPVSARYIVVLTPAELKWKTRVFEAVPE